MSTVDSVVRSTIQDFVRDGVLFTALDVSNKVKEALPLARHREVRDLVRASFTVDIEPASYARTPITVILENGDKAEALLYHPLVDSWDLDAKYDAQKRAQTATQPVASVQAIQAAMTVISNPANLSVPVTGFPVFMKPLPASKVVAAPVPTPVPTPDPATAASRVLWDNLFKAQPSLFPRK
jgi:hypothetical protein